MFATHIRFGDVLWMIVAALMVFALARAFSKERARRLAIRRFLFSVGFVPGELPDDVPVRLLDQRLATGTVLWCYAGKYAGCGAFVAELRVVQGEDSFAQTMVAVKRITTAPYEPVTFLSMLHIHHDQHGRWLLGTIPRHTMDVEAIEGYLTCFT